VAAPDIITVTKLALFIVRKQSFRPVVN